MKNIIKNLMDRKKEARPRGFSVFIFLKDRLLYVLNSVLIISLLIVLMLLERKRFSGFIELATMGYFVLLASLMVGAWLAIDYLRHRQYYNQLREALERSDDLQAATIVQAVVTQEQKLVARLLEEQHRSYLNELGKYRRQQELHNHFVLQWVHYMKTPVSVIDLLAQESKEHGSGSEEDREKLSISLQEETDRLTSGLEMMLYSARLEKFEMDLHINRTALHERIRTVINSHKRLCIRHSIFPKIEGEAWVETDEKWITFVLNQLMSNSIKYSKGKLGAKTLLFRLDVNEEGSGKLQVIDEGIGIASHELPRIFDPFFTGENGRTTGESTGMGLYLAKQVCSRLGHSLSANSVMNEGSTFTIGFEPRGIHRMGR